LKQLNSIDVYSGISGLNFVQDWAPTMVGAYLEQKYRHILNLEKEEATIKARQERRQAKVKSTREAPPGAPATQKVSDRRRARAARKAAHDANTKVLIEADHQYLPKEQAAMHYSPECLAELHPGRHYEEHSAAICEQNIANTDDMLMLLEWQMKTQRVSEYSGYLRTRASQESQRAVQSTQGSVTDSFVSSFSSTLPLGGSGGVFHRPDMDYSQYMQF
jgi:hypothetical protein